MKIKFYDWFVFAFLAVLAVSVGSAVVALLAVIAGLLYLVVRRYFSISKTGIAISRPEDNEFVVSDSDKDGVVDRATIELDVDINYRPAPGHFRLDTRFDLYRGKDEYEYKIDGTSVSLRVLNSRHEPSPDNPEEEWEVRDGVVLESDLRARDEAKKFKMGSIDEKIAGLKSATEWQELTSWAFNGFKYFLLSRRLPAPACPSVQPHFRLHCVAFFLSISIHFDATSAVSFTNCSSASRYFRYRAAAFSLTV